MESRPTLVVDSSTVVAALADAGPDGRWAEDLLSTHALVAPHLMPAEVSNILRRASLAGDLPDGLASIAHGDLLALGVQLFPYEPFADRIWELRDNVTAYDAWYVALAERLDAPLATLDHRVARASGPRCIIETPDG